MLDCEEVVADECVRLPSWPGFVADVVEAEVVQDHEAPIVIDELIIDVPSYVVVDFGKVLGWS